MLEKMGDVIGGATQLRGRRLDAEQRAVLITKTIELRRVLDATAYPYPLPRAVFDPADTRLFGQFASIALIAQERINLTDVTPIYGSGVYAVYYTGDFTDYAAIANTETPIYVGKAQPPPNSVRVQEQGTPLTSRLLEHRRSIEYAENLQVTDFSCRLLVIATGWETPAEVELIRYFQPLWNEGAGPVHGLGKHGDSATTRANRRSPWDTLHPGRPWARRTSEDQLPVSEIKVRITSHLNAYPPVANPELAIEHYVATIARPYQ